MNGHYVVTGGAGFIGSAIVRALLREAAGKIVVIDNLLSGRESNLDEVRKSVDFHNADIRNYDQIAPLIADASVVFHEAAIPSVPRSIDDPVPSHDVNINGTFNVLRAAAATHLKAARGGPCGFVQAPNGSRISAGSMSRFVTAAVLVPWGCSARDQWGTAAHHARPSRRSH